MPPVLEQFGAWMRYHRGVRVSTLENYLPLLHEFVVALGDDAVAYGAAGCVLSFLPGPAGPGEAGPSRS